MSASTGTTSSASVYTTPAFWERLWRTAGIQSILSCSYRQSVFRTAPRMRRSCAISLNFPARLDLEKRELSENMVRYWTQFAGVGNPNSTGAPLWPSYDSTQDGSQSLVPPVPVTEFEFAMDHRCDFWAGFLDASAQRRHKTSK